jgi:hypothetical protein
MTPLRIRLSKRLTHKEIRNFKFLHHILRITHSWNIKTAEIRKFKFFKKKQLYLLYSGFILKQIVTNYVRNFNSSFF